MAKGLIGEKVGMTQIFDTDGKVMPVTVLRVGPCSISQIKTLNRDGYEAIQLAYSETKERKLNKSELNHLIKANIKTPKKVLIEFKGFEVDSPVGSELKIADVFQLNDIVKVTGISKGKGFQGVIKRYGFSGGPETHGSRFQRHPGSIGANSTPSRVFKGMKMAGRMGGVRSTVSNLKIVKIIDNDDLIFVTGSVPGNAKSVVIIEKL